MSENQEDRKIVVDEDWKGQVEREKQAAEDAKGEGEKQEETSAPKGEGDAPEAQLPPASFPALVTSLAAQALAAMGQVPDPAEGHPVVRPDLAKHCIDTLGMLEQKTKGNLTTEESGMLSEILHQLRMLFVSVRNAPPEEEKKS